MRATLERLMRTYGVQERINLPPRYNVAPTDDVATVRAGADGRHLKMVRWGLVPAWSDGVTSGRPLINARAETAAEKPAFRDSFARRRCLVLADGFYEWQRRADGSRQAYFMSRGDDEVFAFAGLWARWSPAKGAAVESCCILTTNASARLAGIHHRMPVVLDHDGEAQWLDPAAERGDLQALLRPADDIDARPVSSRVNSVANDDAGCLAPPEADTGGAGDQFSLL